MVAHKDLTGSDLHENKGANTATVYSVLKADGAGASFFEKIKLVNFDAEIKTVNQRVVTARLTAIITAGSILLPVIETCTLNSITFVQDAVLGTANVTITAYKNSSAMSPTATIATTGVKGTIVTLNPVTNNTFVAGDYIEIASGGGGTGTVNLSIILKFTVT